MSSQRQLHQLEFHVIFCTEISYYEILKSYEHSIYCTPTTTEAGMDEGWEALRGSLVVVVVDGTYR
jgi:hypothetical protein